jgi:PAS domain S-box-containing protein
MGFRFDRSIKRPRFRNRLSKSSVATLIGPRGLSIKRKGKRPIKTALSPCTDPCYGAFPAQQNISHSLARNVEATDAFLSGSGKMIQAVREKDWGQTPLGAISAWPDSLRTSVGICINSQFPLVILWGAEFVFIYNDAYSPMLGDKHPGALGQRGAVLWPEIWPTIGPMLDRVMTEGSSTRDDDLFLLLERRGFVEECYFTFSYSPIKVEDGAVGGVFVAALETTIRVINERRLRTLSDLATKVSLGRDQSNAFSTIADVLSQNPCDLPFTALYLIDSEREVANLAFCSDLGAEAWMPAEQVSLKADDQTCDDHDHPIARAARTSEPVLHDIRTTLGETGLCGMRPAIAQQVLALPFQLPGQSQPRGVFVVGTNPRRPLDKEYREFFYLVLGHIATAVINAEAIEAERRRVESMAELDRAKSQFFSNASHELRTPVTLILGPLREVLDHDNEMLSSPVRERLEMVRRNALRLHKLVNSILDFASIEAGRLLVRPEPVDVGILTSEIASLFRSAIESVGLRFSVQCSVPISRVLIDREMWAKVLMNLISNAFKFTQQGRIDVAVESDHTSLYLKVRDTGSGITPEDLPHIFERFFRTQSVTGRSVEGTGIGLSLVQELVRLHGGNVTVQSIPGAGSTFTVQIPLCLTAAEPVSDNAEKGISRISGAVYQAFSDELQRYALQNDGSPKPAADVPQDQQCNASRIDDRKAMVRARRVKVLIVDDNEDLIRYIERLLQDKCEVISASSGVSGLDAARKWRPDLIVLDVMMPGLDGFGLLKAIRADQTIHTVSVIIVSARAGEEAHLEALHAGADDYLVKPFSARELTARVHSHIQLVRIRRDAVEREGQLLRQIAEVRQDLERVVEGTNDAFANLDRDLRFISLNDATAHLLNMPKRDVIGRFLTEVSPQDKDTDLEKTMQRAMEEQRIVSVEPLHMPSGRWFSVRCYPAHHGLTAFGTDITERKKAEQALLIAHAELECRVAERTQELLKASKLLAAVFDRAPGGIAITDIEGNFIRANAAYQELIGYAEPELLAHSMESLTHPEDYPEKKALLQQLLSGERESFEMEMRYRLPDGTVIWVNNFVSKIDDEGHRPRYFVKITQNIADRKRVEREIQSSPRELRMLYDRLQTVREEERVALAREVHDQLGQILSAAKIDIKLLEDDVRPQGAPLSRRKISMELRSARLTIEKAIQSVRKIATELRPPELEDQGLRAAIEWHARDFERRTRIKCSLTVSAAMREPTRLIATALFRIF